MGSRLQSRSVVALGACRGRRDRASGLSLGRVCFGGCLIPTVVPRAQGCPSWQHHPPTHRPVVQHCPHLSSRLALGALASLLCSRWGYPWEVLPVTKAQ